MRYQSSTKRTCSLSRISFDRVENFFPPNESIIWRFRKANVVIELVSPRVETSAGFPFGIGAGIKGTRAWLRELITRSRHRSHLACHRKLAPVERDRCWCTHAVRNRGYAARGTSLVDVLRRGATIECSLDVM